MILTGPEIKWQVGSGKLVISPFRDEQLNPNSYNLRLHKELLTYRDSHSDVREESPVIRHAIPPEGFWLRKGELYLGRTLEMTETRGFVPMLEGRSSLARLGLFVHISAGFGDNGFKGHWTLEFFPVRDVKVYAGMEVCQIAYHTLLGDEAFYSSKYQDNSGVQPSFMFKEFRDRQDTGSPKSQEVTS